MARISAGEVISGRVGGRVYRTYGGEAFVAAAPATNDPLTQKQMDARARLELTNRLWAELPLDVMARWRAYAAIPRPFPSPKGRKSSTRGDLAFKGLAAKYLQIHGGSVVPTEPPTSPFLGDGLSVTVTGSPTGVLFNANGPNFPGVLTELLLQRLPARHRMPHPEDYRTQRFVTFEAGSTSTTVECPPGAYACAIRFVRSDTGQETPIVPLGVVQVASPVPSLATASTEVD